MRPASLLPGRRSAVRVAAPNYADGVAAMVSGPPSRYVSNRVFNDVGQNLFSENDVSQWGWAWGQFIDHDIGLRDETPGEAATIGFDAGDPLEGFTNDFGAIGFSRTPAAPGSGSTSPRQQINTISSYMQIDNSLRSVLFQVPKPGVPDPTVCEQPVIQPDCFTVLLPRRPRSAADPAALRDRLPAQPRRPDRARYRRDGAAERLRSDGLMN